jgi:hypothetical protein
MIESPPLSYDDFIKSIAFGKKTFESEVDLIDCLEKYIYRHYQYSIERESTPPNNYGFCRYIYKVTFENSNAIIYVENFSDACDYEDKSYTNVQLIRTQKTSDIYRQANTNSMRKSIEYYIDYFEPEFMIGGVMKQIEYFGKPHTMNDE